MRRRATNSRWVECFGVVTFDLHQGQRIECMQPKLALTPEQESEIAFLCFPDANLINDGDSSHYFVFGFDAAAASQNNSTNNSSSSPISGINNNNSKSSLSAKATELFGVARFRQKKDPTIPRGALQKSVFVLSRCPFPTFLENFCMKLFTKILDEPDEKYTTKEFKRAEDGSNADFCNEREKNNTRVLERLDNLLQELYDEVSAWPRIASNRLYSAGSSSSSTPPLTMFNQPLPPFVTPSGIDGSLMLMGVRPATKTIKTHVCMRDYSTIQQLRNLLSFPVDAIQTPRIQTMIMNLCQQILNRRVPWYMKWCKSQGFNLVALSLDNPSDQLTPPPVMTQEHVVSLHDAAWEGWIDGAEGFEDIPPSPLRSTIDFNNDDLTSQQQNTSSPLADSSKKNDSLEQSMKLIRVLLLGEEEAAKLDREEDAANNNNNNNSKTNLVSEELITKILLGEGSSSSSPSISTTSSIAPDPQEIGRRFSVPSEVAATLRRALEAALDEAAQTLLEINQMTEVNDEKQQQQQQHELWSDIKLSSCLHHHIQKLPKFWELMIAGEDIAVVGPDARTVSSAVVGLRSLLGGGVPYVGNLRPFLTINNREVDGLEVARDRKKAISAAVANVSVPAASSPRHYYQGGASGSPHNNNIMNSPTGSSLSSPNSTTTLHHNNNNNNNNNNTATNFLQSPTSPHQNSSNNSVGQQQQQPVPISSSLDPSATTAAAPLTPHSLSPPNQLNSPTTTTSTTTLVLAVNNNRPSLIGATNPFFVKHFELWPHMICLGADNSDEKTHKMYDSDSDKRAKQQFSLKSRVFSSRHFLIKSDKSVLEQLASCVKKQQQQQDFARLYTNELNQKFFGLLERIVDSILHSSPDMLYISDEAVQGLCEPESLLALLKEQPSSAFDKFKSTKEALMLYTAFFRTQTFVAWLQRHVRKYVRQQLMICNLQDLIGRCPVSTNHYNNNNSNNNNSNNGGGNYFEYKIDILHLLHWELMKQLEAPVLDVEYLERLYHLNRAAMPLRDRLWSEL